MTTSFDSYRKLMKITKASEQLYKDTDDSHTCLLKNHPGAADHFYGQSHGLLYLRISPRNCVELIIASIDDGSIVFLGPTENKDASLNRINIIIQEIESWDGWIPTEQQCQQFEKNCGMFWNK